MSEMGLIAALIGGFSISWYARPARPPPTNSRQTTPEVPIERQEDFDMILKLLDSIDERDARVIRLRFGLEGQPPLTLKEIGREVGLTRERVRQIEMEALRRLQSQMLEDRPGRYARSAPDDTSQHSGPVRIHRGQRAMG